VIESDFGGAATGGISLQVFDLSHESTQTLDIPRTLRTHGQQFCVAKRTLFENGTWFSPPRISHPCYKRGEGVGLSHTVTIQPTARIPSR